MRKDIRLAEKARLQKEKRDLDKGILPPATEPKIKKVSSAINFLDQTLGLSPSPYDAPKRCPSPELLKHGVSSDGQGRYGYLKMRILKGPQARYGNPTTSSHAVGWGAPTYCSAGGSPFAHRPLIQNTFYRTNGALRKPSIGGGLM